MIISFRQPLDLVNTLESGQAFRWRREGEWLYGVIFNNIVKIRQIPEGVEFFCAPDDEPALELPLKDYLRLDDDLEAIYRAISVDERINAAICHYPGMRILRQDPWECLISFICSANSNIPRISANVEDISNSFGHLIRLDGIERSTFPTPERLAEAGEQRLRQLRLGFRARYVDVVANVVADGQVNLFALREAPYAEALEVLTALPGVGDKVANCILLFSLDKPGAFPVDVWIDRALREWYPKQMTVKEGKPLTRKSMRPWAQQYFGLYAGYANQYLFQRRRLQARAKE